jgi:hypothetical protein
VSPEVLAQMKAAMQESSSAAASHSFLLDDDSAIPFNHSDVERMVDDKASQAAAIQPRHGTASQPASLPSTLAGPVLPDVLQG